MNSELQIILASPRGFCAGVERAIRIVENALIKYGPPIYVRHEIVHNRHVVDELKSRGAIFIDELDDAPAGARVIFSAHGVAKQVYTDAQERQLEYIDATCPLVSKVHKGAERYYRDGCQLILIGHADHPEVIGTMGQVPDGAVVLVQTPEDVADLNFPDGTSLAYVTQTTLSVDDTAEIVACLKARFPDIREPRKSDICYATSNRQEAVRTMADQAELILVIGAQNSSNSNRLVEVARIAGCPQVQLISCVDDVDWGWFHDVTTLGLSAGASAPETLVQQVLDECKQRYSVQVTTLTTAEENVRFRLPSVVADIEPLPSTQVQ